MLYVYKVRTRYIVRTTSREAVLGQIREYDEDMPKSVKKYHRNAL